MEIKNSITAKINSLLIKEQYQSLEFLTTGIRKHAIIKGAVLSKYCYNNVYSRGMGDIDILIPKCYINQFEEELKKQNFTLFPGENINERFKRIFMISSSHQYFSYYKNLSNSHILLDINFDIFWGEYEGKRIDIEEFLCDTIDIDICGVKIKTLPPIKTLIQLILHHYKDMNSIYLLATHKSIKYDMFKDIYYLLKNNINTITLDKLYAMSTDYEIIPYVFYVLYHTGLLFNDEMLNQYVEAFRTAEGERLLNCYGLCSKERKEWKFDFKARLDADNLYELIKDDLTEKDQEKIAINKSIFMGVSK